MAGIHRCYSTNTAYSQYIPLYMALRTYFANNPPAEGEPTLLDHIKEWGVDIYPCLMRIVSNVRFIDAHLIGNLVLQQ